jgi:hypothetical protein
MSPATTRTIDGTARFQCIGLTTHELASGMN